MLLCPSDKKWLTKKEAAPADTTAPTFVSATPSNGATSVNRNAGSATIIFDENIAIANQAGITIKKASDNANVKSGNATGNANTLTINYAILEYNTSYKINIAAWAIEDLSGNATTAAITIYFTTQNTSAPDITSLYLSDLDYNSVDINFSSDNTNDAEYYRVSTVAYSGSWNMASGSPIEITDLSANTTYYYQIALERNGQTTYSVPMSFKTASAANGIIVNSLQRVLNETDPTVNGDYSNGYHFRFGITINNLLETELQFKLANRSKWTSDYMLVNSNTRIRATANGTNDYTTGTTLTGTSYTVIDTDVSDIDNDSNLWGRQLYLDMFYKIPSNAAGVYTTTYGIRTPDAD